MYSRIPLQGERKASQKSIALHLCALQSSSLYSEVFAIKTSLIVSLELLPNAEDEPSIDSSFSSFSVPRTFPSRPLQAVSLTVCLFCGWLENEGGCFCARMAVS